MVDILLGCDHHSASYDSETKKVIANILRKAGHKVEVLNTGPNYTQSAMKKASSKGKIAVFLVNGADLQTYKDVAMGIKKGYYHVKYCYFGLEGFINKKTCTCNGAKTVKLKKAHDDASSSSFTKELIGMTTAEVCRKYSNYISYACGSSREELGKNLVGVIGGTTSNTGSDSDSSGSGGSNVKECIQKLLKHWDGDVECYMRGDEVHINKVRNPQQYHSCKIMEEENVIIDSVSITDVNPDTINHLTVTWKGGKFEFRDEKAIIRFGEKAKTTEATKKVVTTILEKKETSDSTDTNTENTETGTEDTS